MGQIKLHCGDSYEILKTLPDNSIDSIVTDPPYGLSFMGKDWDVEVPKVALWKECFRVLKPGGHLLSFFGTRTYHHGAIRIENAGFEIRDQIMWLYGSGFPKSHNIGDGRGTALKPANEPIVMARKPLEKGLTVARNVLKWGTGALNIDGSRIEAAQDLAELNRPNKRPKSPTQFMASIDREFTPSQGRWPANVILDEEAAKALDEQSGPLNYATKPNSIKGGYGSMFGIGGNHGSVNQSCYGKNKSGASRFFYVAKASKAERNAGLEDLPLVKMDDHVGKRKLVAQAEGPKNPNLPRQNFHPTVKPIKLMSYLIKMVTPPGGVVLDPFMGSGTTGVAAKSMQFGFVGIELSEEYFKIAEKRITSKIRSK